jgi:hypothetical protein
VEWRECIFFEHGWDDFAEDNRVAFVKESVFI